ncbi:MAG: sporulation protein YqfD [Eubacterium sp.]|nr:sporulation protein YqfD [Eubacterium sp.]
MLIRLFRWLLGYVKFSYSGGFKEDFINDCYRSGINLKNLCTRGEELLAETKIKTYKRLHKIAFAHGGKVKIMKRKGLPFLLSPLNNRWGLFAGAVFFLFFISFMGGFVWNITVTGNNRVTEVKIVDYLAQNGFSVGTRWGSVDKEQLEISIMAYFEDVAWISINKIGSTASIEIDETVNKPEMTERNVTNVRASQDGVIVRLTVNSGWAEVKEGDAVTAGDLLISGIRESEIDKKNHYAHAKGTVLAQVESAITLNVSRRQTEKSYTYDKEYKTLYFFGMEIPLYLKKDEGTADVSAEREYLVINSYRLPVGIITEKSRYYISQTLLLSDSELEILARAELEKRKTEELGDLELISEKVSLQMNEDDCNITGKYSYIKDIGEETEILFEEQ